MNKNLVLSLSVFGLAAMTLWAAEEAKCPVSGKPADLKNSINVNGKKVSFCCDKCPSAFEKKLSVKDEGPGKCPISGDAASKESRMLLSVTEAVHFCCEKCQAKYAKQNNVEVKDEGPGKCPMSGEDAVADAFVVHNGKKVYFCCNNCAKKYVKQNSLVIVDKGPGKCPVCNEKAEKEQVLYHTKAKAVYFCCDDCIGKYMEKEMAAK